MDRDPVKATLEILARQERAIALKNRITDEGRRAELDAIIARAERLAERMAALASQPMN